MPDPNHKKTPRVPETASWFKVITTTVVVLLLVTGVVVVARLLPVTHRFYTDADLIRRPIELANTRDILWQPARSMSELINTTADDYEPRLSADGMTLYFVRGKAGYNAQIHYSIKSPTGWSKPQPLDAVNSAYDELGPEPSRDGQSLYFYSDRPGGSGGYDLWVARRSTTGWHEPINLGPLVNSEFNDYGPALTPDSSVLYFASNRPDPAGHEAHDPDAWPATLREDLYQHDYDLYASALTPEGMAKAIPLTTLNTPFNDGAPAVSSFGDFLYFASDRSGGEGGFDLYRSWRVLGEHRPADNLGSSVNTPANEMDPGLSLGGYALYFSSDRRVEVAAADQAPSYDLYYTTSREVFTVADQVARSPMQWSAIWSAIGPNLLWVLVALALLLAMLALLRGMHGRRMSLLAKCLLGSITAHLLLLLLFNAWEVTAALAKEFSRRGPIRIALASPTTGTDLFTQIRGKLTSVETPTPTLLPAQRHTVPTPSNAVEATATLAVLDRPFTTDDQPQFASGGADDAIPPQRQREPPDFSTDVQNIDSAPLDAAMPALQERMAVNEPRNAESPRPVDTPPASRPPVDVSITPSTATDATLDPVRLADSMQGVADQRMELPATVVRDADTTPTPDAVDFGSTTTLVDLPQTAELVITAAPTGRRPVVVEKHQDVPTAPVRVDRAAVGAATMNSSTVDRAVELSPETAGTPSDETLTDASTVKVVDASTVPTSSATTMATARPSLPTVQDLVLPQLDDNKLTATTETAEQVVTASGSPVRSDSLTGLSKPIELAEVAMISPQNVPISNSLDSTFTIDPSLVADANDRGVFAIPSAAMDRLTLAVPMTTSLPELAELAMPQMEESEAERFEERSTEMMSVETESLRAAIDITSTLADASARDPMFDPGTLATDLNAERSASLVELSVADTLDTGFADLAAPTLDVSDTTPTIPTPMMALDLDIPTESVAPENPYAQRTVEDKLAIVERMGGSKETEEAVARALKWLARHQSSDGRWDADGFDDGCDECDGETDIEADHALTALSLLSFLGAGHTHVGDGPYQRNVEAALGWLLDQQNDDGDLRGDETMYSHGIATIALSEAFGMTHDRALRRPVERAVRFIEEARNRNTGGWRYDPGQAGDTSVTGWQVMALKSAHINGVIVPADAFNAARTWLDRVSRSGSRGLYSYKPNRRYTPSMTAEGMFTQQLLGRRRDDPRMRASADYLLRHLPDWDDEVNTYYWYYATLALYQHGGPPWRTWNASLTRELLNHQRRDGAASGSWNPDDDEWADKGGRVYQTTLCTLMLEVYYRYLPLYSMDMPVDAVGRIDGTVVDGSTGKPLAGASIRLSLKDRPAMQVTTDQAGHYTLAVPEVPDFFALSASKRGFSPSARNVDAAMLMGTTHTVDFDLRPTDESIVSVEAVPEVHHLGDDDFSGSINSQFQKDSEGDRFEAEFELAATQLSPHYARAEVRLLAKGVQRRHRIRINGSTLEERLEDAPDDGSFGEFRASFDADLLRRGLNKIEIIAKPSSSDIDDFEFVNVQILLSP